MIIGKIGSGKSALLQAIIGDLTSDDESYYRIARESVAYTAQVSWIQNATLRKNIIFNEPYDAEHYKQVVRACALMPDFAQLSAADRTEIGEKGINLSGGQKQRVALARAVYADSDIVLLDDPLSAVDTHVQQHLFEHCITGILNEKTVILCTNALKFLPKADNIIMLQKGKIMDQGTYDVFIKKNMIWRTM
eukprot:UN29238